MRTRLNTDKRYLIEVFVKNRLNCAKDLYPLVGSSPLKRSRCSLHNHCYPAKK